MTLAFENQFNEFELDAGADRAFELESIDVMPAPIDVTPAGTESTLNWRAVSGATGVRLDASTVTIAPTVSGERDVGVVSPGKNRVDSFTVTSPAPGALIRSLSIPNLRRHEGDEEIDIDSVGTLGSFRLVLTPIVGGQELAPIISVRSIPRVNALPAQLVGGALSGSRFTLPDVVGDKFKVTVVTGDAPEDFVSQSISFGDVRMSVAPGPVGLHLDGPDGAEIYAVAGPITARTEYDVSAAVQRHLGGVVVDGAPSAAITVRSDVVGSASVRWITNGRVLRRFDDRLTVETTGSAASIAVPAPKPGRASAVTIADVVVTHHGSALHPLSDALPTTDADLGGPRVRDVPVVRELPPEALRDQYITRLGVIGWPSDNTDLSLTVLDATATVVGLGGSRDRDPATLVWFEFDEPLAVDRSVSVTLVATRGAFDWIADPDPLLRIVVTATPSGERVVVAGRTIWLTGEETVEMRTALSGTDEWSVDTDQFCTVAISNAVMEFAP